MGTGNPERGGTPAPHDKDRGIWQLMYLKWNTVEIGKCILYILKKGNPRELDLARTIERRVSQGGYIMATYFMFGNYSHDSIKKIRSRRTDETRELIEKHGGTLTAGYALLGEKDLVLIVDMPNTEQAMKTSVALSKMLGVGFSTLPAVSVETFDKITEDL